MRQSESSCTTSRKLFNLSKEETEPIEEVKSIPKQANATTNSCVVRTKATRCTKVVISQEPQNNINNFDHHDPISSSIVVNYEQVDDVLHDDEVPKMPLMFSDDDHQNNNDYSEFMMLKFETDHENFMKEFLNMDFLHFSCSLRNNEEDGNVDCGTGKEGQSSSPKSEEDQSQTPMFSEDTDHNLYGADLLSGLPCN